MFGIFIWEKFNAKRMLWPFFLNYNVQNVRIRTAITFLLGYRIRFSTQKFSGY